MTGPSLDNKDDGRKEDVGRKPSKEVEANADEPKRDEAFNEPDDETTLPTPKLPDDEMELGNHMDRSEYDVDEKKEEGKGEETDDDEDADDEDEESSDDDPDEKRAKYLQKRHDKMMNFLDENDPALADKLRAEVSGRDRQGRFVADPPDLTREPESKTSALPEGTTIADLSVDQFNDLMQRNQQKAIKEARAEDRHSDEVQKVQHGVSDYAEQLGLTTKEVGNIITKMEQERIDTTVLGGPTRYGRSICSKLQILALQKQLRRRTTKAEADAEDKTRRAVHTRQPKKTDAGAPRKTPEQRHLDDMDRVGPAHSGSGLLDSKRK